MGRGVFTSALFKQYSTAIVQAASKPSSIEYGMVHLNILPVSDTVSVLDSSSSLKVSFQSPKSSRGSAITAYQIEWWDQRYDPEVEVIEVSGSDNLIGTFRILYDNDITDYITVDATAEMIRNEIESLYGIHSVQVFRSIPLVQNHGYVWSVTFVQDFPSVYGKKLSIDSAGVAYSNASGEPFASITMMTSSKLPRGYGSMMLPTTNSSSYTSTIENLIPGVAYNVFVSAINSEGYSAAQMSIPSKLAPPIQKPSEPLSVRLLTHSGNSLQILWRHPESNGGDVITKYKIEWDGSPNFRSNGGSVLGSHHKFVSSNQNCSLTHCSYVISGLQKGQLYFVRIYSYNSLGYSIKAGFPQPISQAPMTVPMEPSFVKLSPLQNYALQVDISPPFDNGGSSISQYKIEWDVLGAEAYDSNFVADIDRSLLYSPYDVQVIRTSSNFYDLDGYFYVGFDVSTSDKIPIDATAELMQRRLEDMPSVGNVEVRRTENEDHGYSWTITFYNSEWWRGSKLFDVPELTVSNLDNYHVSNFTKMVSCSPCDGSTESTFSGTSASISVATLVNAMAGFEQQSIKFEASEGYLNGYVILSFNGSSTAALSVNSTAKEFENALESLPHVGDVIVRRQNFVSNGAGFALYVVFIEQLGNVGMLSANIKYMTTSLSSGSVLLSYSELVSGVSPVFGSKYRNSTVIAVVGEGSTTSYVIRGLAEGLAYHVRVSAFNGVNSAYGKSRGSFPAVVTTASYPSAVTDINGNSLNDTSLRVSWRMPTNDGGRSIESYAIEYDYASNVKEVQVVRISASSASMSGSFCLSFNGISTSNIPYDATSGRLGEYCQSLFDLSTVTHFFQNRLLNHFKE
jgi:hypothetical protein